METFSFQMRCPAVQGFWEVGGADCPLMLSDDRLALITTWGDIHELTADGARRWVGRVYPADENRMNRVLVRIDGSDDADQIEDLVRDALIAFEGNPAAALTRYSKRFNQCQICNRGLTNDTSRRLGVGPDCRGRRDQLAMIRQESREWIRAKQQQARTAMRQWRQARKRKVA